MSGTYAPADGRLEAELVIGGMTCGSCAARIERRLNGLDGVTATVNYATGRAYVTSLGGRDASELISAVQSAGYTAELPADAADEPGADQATRTLGRRLAVCIPLAAAVIALAMAPALQFAGWQWVSLVLAAPVATWGAWPVHRAAWAGLTHGTATMDTLVSIGVAASFGWSVYALLVGGADMTGMKMSFAFTFAAASSRTLYFEAAAGVTTAVLAGRYLEARARHRSASALAALAALGAKTVAVLRDGAEQRVPVDALAIGDLFVVRPGEKVATDGIVTQGSSAVDASLVTGESIPAEVGPGDTVTGATINMSGRLTVRATRVGSDTLLAQISRLVSQAQATKSSAQRLADRIAAVFVPCVIALAVATLGFWLGAGLPGAASWSAAVAVLVVACPCALGLATPAAMLAASGRGAELGILVKNPQALEAAGRIGAVIMDKTGTLTTGRMTVHQVIAMPGTQDTEALLLAGAVEDASEHPIGQAVAREAAALLGALPVVTCFTALPGAGVQGAVDGRVITVGSRQLLTQLSIALPERLLDAVGAAESAGRTAVLVAWGELARAAVVLADGLKPQAGLAVASLRDLGLRPALLTGDNERAALQVAGQLGIPAEDVFAGVAPEGKVAVLQRLQANGKRVAFAGDGVNDAAALAHADLGVAIGSAADAAIGAADLTLVSGDPSDLATAIQLARATIRVIRANLAWASAYNVIAIPLAALGYVNPLFAGAAMSVSSLVVVGNSLRLLRFKPATARRQAVIAAPAQATRTADRMAALAEDGQ